MGQETQETRDNTQSQALHLKGPPLKTPNLPKEPAQPHVPVKETSKNDPVRNRVVISPNNYHDKPHPVLAQGCSRILSIKSAEPGAAC